MIRCKAINGVGAVFLCTVCEEGDFSPLLADISEAAALEVPIAQDIIHIEDLSNVNNILVVAGPSKLSLDEGERILDERLAEENLIRAPGQPYTPRDMNCGPKALLHLVCSTHRDHLWTEDRSDLFRRTVANHAELLVELGDLVWPGIESLENWKTRIQKPGIA